MSQKREGEQRATIRVGSHKIGFFWNAEAKKFRVWLASIHAFADGSAPDLPTARDQVRRLVMEQPAKKS